MSQPKFSIVIPTVDRPQLLEKTLAACLLSAYPNLEVLVSDNFSAPDTARVVEGFRGDPRVRYVRTASRLSMPDHWEFAWKQSRGDYIIINGDDDGFTPGLIDQLARYAPALDAGLMSWDAGLYYHPDWDLSGANTFVFMNRHSRLLFDIEPQALFAAYGALQVPMCFPQGTRMCFSRRLAERAVKAIGRVFWSPYPDFSAPLLLLAMLRSERYVYWDALAGYGGRSRESNAAAWDKEHGKAGSAQRAKEYFEELHEDDPYPHSTLKIRAYANGHSETLALLRHLLPEAFAPYRTDPQALVAAIECELRGIGIHNPFLGPREREAFDRFVRDQDPALVQRAMATVKERTVADQIEAWRSKRSTFSWSLLRVFVSPALLKWVTLRVLARAHRMLFQPATPAAQGAAALPQLSAVQRDHKTWLQCASVGAGDSLDLARLFEQIVAACDRRSVSNFEEFYNKGFLRAAYEPTSLAVVETSARALRQSAS